MKILNWSSTSALRAALKISTPATTPRNDGRKIVFKLLPLLFKAAKSVNPRRAKKT